MTTQQPQQPQLIDPVPQGHTQRRRSFSSHQPKGPQPRRRFYKHVGVTEVSPPWELRLQAKRERAAGKAKSAKAIDNPISAGVDGTQSASGVIGHLGVVGVEDDLSDRVRMEELKERLIPRCTTITNLTGVMDHHAPDQWYTVTLDGKHLRTPVGQVLSVPSKLLAWAIAAEWDSQTTQIQPVQMPLMTLTCTALDQTAAHPEHYHKMALQYLPTDTVRGFPPYFLSLYSGEAVQSNQIKVTDIKMNAAILVLTIKHSLLLVPFLFYTVDLLLGRPN